MLKSLQFNTNKSNIIYILALILNKIFNGYFLLHTKFNNLSYTFTIEEKKLSN